MYKTELKNIKQGSIFRLLSNFDSTIYVRDHYDRSSKKYCFHPYYDSNKVKFGLPTRFVYAHKDSLICVNSALFKLFE